MELEIIRKEKTLDQCLICQTRVGGVVNIKSGLLTRVRQISGCDRALRFCPSYCSKSELVQATACTAEKSRNVLLYVRRRVPRRVKEPTLRILRADTPARLAELTEGPFQTRFQKGEIIAEEIPTKALID